MPGGLNWDHHDQCFRPSRTRKALLFCNKCRVEHPHSGKTSVHMHLIVIAENSGWIQAPHPDNEMYCPKCSKEKGIK